MSIDEALNELMSRRLWYDDLGIKKNTAHRYQQRLKTDSLSLEKKIEILNRAGMEVQSNVVVKSTK